MDQRTADSLFGSNEDDPNVDFFGQPSTLSTALQAEPEPDETQLTHANIKHANQTHNPVDHVSHDPYSQLKAYPKVLNPPTSPPVVNDPYSATQTSKYQPYNYAPNATSPAPATYTAPASQVSSYDPYAKAGAILNVSQQAFSPTQQYTSPQNNYGNQPMQAIPTPPPPTNVDVSKYRTKPNAYDPPIRSSPVAKTPSRFAAPPITPSANGLNRSTYSNVPPQTTHVPPPPQQMNQGYLPRQHPSSPPTKSVVPSLNAPPYGAKPPTPQTKPGLVNPPPRVVSPYAPRTGVTATPPPRAMSASSHRSQGYHAGPPSVALPAAGSGSRPSSTSPSIPRSLGSPEPLPRVLPQAKPPPPVVEHQNLEPNNRTEVSYLMAMDDGDPTPTIASTFARNNYMGAEDSYLNNVIEDPYPPPEPDEVAETLVTSKPPQPPTSDPYAPIKPPQASTYQPTRVSSPPRAFTSPPVGMAKPPPKAIPQVRKESLVSDSTLVPPISTGVPRDPYAPKTPPVNISPQKMLTPAASGVIDLSHSPPNIRQPISSYDPYNPSSSLRRTDTMGSIESTHTQPYTVAPPNPYAPTTNMSPDVAVVDRTQYAGYVPTPQASSNAYAPSPSLLGTNDPLGRASVRVPIFSFGFGGRVVVCFHNNPGMGAFDGMAPGKPSTALSVKTLKDVIPTTAYDVTDSSFPGPLFNDQGTGGATSVLQTTAALTKAKKSNIIQWLDARIVEEEGGVAFRGLGESQDGSPAKAEGRVVLMKLLKIWIDNDGKLSGSPAIEEAVREALLGPPKESSAFTEAAAIGYGYQGNGPQSSSGESVVATYQVKSSSLDKVQEFLMRGDRRQAYRSALDEKLWAHALLISSSVDQDAWKEVVHEFIKSELALSQTTSNGMNPLESNQGSRESLRIAYGLFAGDGPSARKTSIKFRGP
ncbi:12834_t:CDS:2 [Acaulospora colombiana]|uniref:12834_t:CDS:1 n=1 Tax=Acaulospora colombiana TaxID=27376 RepID=A0ACA9LX47_9GLOM|nr:12834_t:CDS:2 [Acaulospora colombiana]